MVSISRHGKGHFWGMTSGFLHMLSTNVPIGRPQKQSSVTLNFPNEIPCDAASRQNYFTACLELRESNVSFSVFTEKPVLARSL